MNTKKLIECRRALREVKARTAGSPDPHWRYLNGLADRTLVRTSPFDKDAVDFPSDVEPPE